MTSHHEIVDMTNHNIILCRLIYKIRRAFTMAGVEFRFGVFASLLISVFTVSNLLAAPSYEPLSAPPQFP
jgi:hypothetical protein